MNRSEMLLEIATIKQKLANGVSSYEATNLIIALMALYDSVVALDSRAQKDSLLSHWESLIDESFDEQEAA